MEVKNLFDPSVKQEIISRINKLTPQSQRLWGKMDVAQMLAHVQAPIGVAFGTNTVKGNWLMKLILPFFKKMLYDEKPWKQGLPTDKTESNMINEKHPVFGKLTKENWSKATWKHIDHHLKQFGA
jgi:hypothetical protein